MKPSKLIITAIILLALISLAVPKGTCLDVSCRAIKARPSPVYNETALGLGYTGKGITIAVIDTGVDDKEHESLKNKFVAGVDFTKPINPITNPDDGSVNPDDIYGHGTFAASCAIGTGGSSHKYEGVAPDAKLIDVKLGYGAVSVDRFVDAIEWCIQHKDADWDNNGPSLYDGIDVISCQQGTDIENSDGKDAVSLAANKAVENGMVFVCAVPNNGPDNNGFYPPIGDKVIAVGAIDDKNTVVRDDDEWINWSSRGPRADDGDDDHYDELKPNVVAPGVNIMGAKYNTEDEYWEQDGTSWSGPMVAGVVALMLQANPLLKPTPDRNPIQEILRKTAESRGTLDSGLGYEDSDSYYNYSYGWGIVDAYKAVRAAEEWEVPHQNIPPSISIINPKNNAEVSDTIMISGSASDSDDNVTNVELRFDDNNWFNVSIASASSLEWNYTWNTKNVENGVHTIYAKAYDGMNYSGIKSVDVNVYNEASAGGVEEETKINPVYLISGAGIIGAVVIIVIFVLLFRRKRLAGLPVSVPPTAPPPVSQPVPFVTAKCPTCGNIIQITSVKRPVKVRCSKCGARSILR